MKNLIVYSHACSSEYDMDTYLEKDHSFASTGIYLHGELESRVGYDIVYVPVQNSIHEIADPKKRTEAYREAILKHIHPGIHDVVVKADGEEHIAKAYVYADTCHNGRFRGLIVLSEDTESLEYAVKCFETQKQHL